MKKILKIILLIILVGVIIGSIVACESDSGDLSKNSEDSSALPEEINFGILRVPNEETIAIAEGIFDKYFGEKGIKTNFIVFDSGVDANKALASGSIDFATMGNTNSIIALSMDIYVEMIWIHEILGEIEGLAVKNGSGINSIEDLEGEKIATPFASTSHFSLLNALKDAEIDDQVQLLDMQTSEIVAAWERGDIQAAYTWQPSLGNLLEDGEILVSSEEMAKRGYVTANVEVVRKEFAKEYPELVSDFISCLTEAADIYRKAPEKASEIVAEELEIKPEEALEQMKGSIWATREELLKEDYFGTEEKPGNFTRIMKETSDFLQEQGSIGNSPSQEEFNQYVNPLYIEKSLETDFE
ncbi:ABC transporter substrate-binding protein [Clostridium sp. D2Q-14]|uniref:taurine ABC transporter substrate-binding protein n=1 Tax=Anaeromonas gelatinilytica TaxID=2683194 RepID=UPI00193BE669|nr:glycine betaine ABC transporter substrate-binding protein [Anaeromonas gelatinilytica]MBS4535248.1 ABC transporter substrate-binding protein [Anaeromonas gelatinilytica]